MKAIWDSLLPTFALIQTAIKVRDLGEQFPLLNCLQSFRKFHFLRLLNTISLYFIWYYGTSIPIGETNLYDVSIHPEVTKYECFIDSCVRVIVLPLTSKSDSKLDIVCFSMIIVWAKIDVGKINIIICVVCSVSGGGWCFQTMISQ